VTIIIAALMISVQKGPVIIQLKIVMMGNIVPQIHAIMVLVFTQILVPTIV